MSERGLDRPAPTAGGRKIQIPRKVIQACRNEIQAGRNKFQISRNEIQIQIPQFTSQNPNFFNDLRLPSWRSAAFFFFGPDSGSNAAPKVGDACPSGGYRRSFGLRFRFLRLFEQVKGWCLFKIADLGRL